jgi:hypothetical protein
MTALTMRQMMKMMWPHLTKAEQDQSRTNHEEVATSEEEEIIQGQDPDEEKITAEEITVTEMENFAASARSKATGKKNAGNG